MLNQKTKILMLGAMYENGGNTTHRSLDGHPELFVYPFESQVGTKYVVDHFSSLYPIKYRWPVFPSHLSAEQCYEAIIDEEGKVRSKTPMVSKFRDQPFDLTDENRRRIFVELMKDQPMTRPNLVRAFFQSTMDAWKDYKRSGNEKCYVGYSPIIGVDAERIINEYEGQGYFLHVVRNPFSAYGDTSKRPVPLSIEHYMAGYCVNQLLAITLQRRYPEQFFILRYEDLISTPERKHLGAILAKMGISDSPTLAQPSWNGKKLDQVYPWGTIRIPTPEVNLQTARELNKAQIDDIRERTRLFIDHFGYEDISAQLK